MLLGCHGDRAGQRAGSPGHECTAGLLTKSVCVLWVKEILSVQKGDFSEKIRVD